MVANLNGPCGPDLLGVWRRIFVSRATVSTRGGGRSRVHSTQRLERRIGVIRIDCGSCILRGSGIGRLLLTAPAYTFIMMQGATFGAGMIVGGTQLHSFAA